ncbi:MAG TPA: PP2C family serine/threonine-protein phosphatase [Polyangiales bacterium]|nr:PP2C family serine/threonine-protein phosphatase [Polyangiales bacterium]
MRRSAGLTDVGRRRSSNEDSFVIDEKYGLYAVADGMGGHAAGEVASQEAIDTVRGMVRQGEKDLRAVEAGDHSPEALWRVGRLLESAVQAATYMVFGIAQNDPSQTGMGTTLSALLLCGRFGVVAQVGDSRVYMVRDEVVSQLTEDHTLINWQLKQGIISPNEAALSPHKNVITRAIGSRDYVQVDTTFFQVEPGDVFMLCSDGLHGYVEDDKEIAEVIALGPDAAVKEFINTANMRGGRDNITTIVVQVDAKDGSSPAEAVRPSTRR